MSQILAVTHGDYSGVVLSGEEELAETKSNKNGWQWLSWHQMVRAEGEEATLAMIRATTIYMRPRPKLVDSDIQWPRSQQFLHEAETGEKKHEHKKSGDEVETRRCRRSPGESGSSVVQ